MLKDILESEGAQELSKSHQRAVNGGEKCRTLAISDEPYGPYNGGNYAPQTCTIQCRPSFLGIGFGSWGEPQDVPCG
jgi:hypothetical protein